MKVVLTYVLILGFVIWFGSRIADEASAFISGTFETTVDVLDSRR